MQVEVLYNHRMVELDCKVELDRREMLATPGPLGMVVEAGNEARWIEDDDDGIAATRVDHWRMTMAGVVVLQR